MNVFSILAVVLVVCSGRDQAPPQAEMPRATSDSRREALEDALRGKSAKPLPEVASLVREALDDPDPEVKIRALWVAYAKAGALRDSARPDRDDRTAETVRGIKARALTLLKDPNPKVRHASILTAGTLDAARDGTSRIRLSSDVIEALAVAFRNEQDLKVRVEIIKTFALISNTDRPIIDSIQAALGDMSDGVVQYAVMGTARLRLTPLLPEVVRALSSDERGVRVAAAQALTELMPQSRKYAKELSIAAGSEQDPETLKVMLEALKTLR